MTIRHIVLFKFLPGITWEDPRTVAAAELSGSHAQHIDEIEKWWAGPDIARRDVSYDFAVMGLFADWEALRKYQEHPHHQEGVKHWRELASWIVVDLDEHHAHQPVR